MLGVNSLEKEDKEKFVCNSPDDSYTTNFIIDKEGLIYLKAKINNTNGLFLFDTGCELTSVNEKIVTEKKMKLHPYTIYDSKGITQTKNVYKVKSFELGAIGIEKLHVYPTDSLSWTDPKGSHYKQDSILGTIGNNIISKFIWDFDLINHHVTVSNNKRYCHNLPDSLAIALVSKNSNKEISVLINGVRKMLLLDFGCSQTIILADSIPNQEITKEKINLSVEHKSSLNHLDSINGRVNNINFVNLQLGSNLFKEIICVGNDHVNVFGIPFIWAFERVVLDFENNRAYFISKNNTLSNYSIDKYKRNYINGNATINMKCKPNGLKFILQSDLTRISYVLFGNIVMYKSNSKLDSIICLDSLRLPNGQIKFGPATLKVEHVN